MAYKVPDRVLKFYSMNSCVIQEIEGLVGYGYGENGMIGALADFCQQNLEQKQTKFKTLSALPQKLYSHYVFCAGVDHGKTASYGSKFADAIRAHKLGVVVEAPLKENEAYHPGRNGQAWLWCPDTAALLVWWGKWKEENQLPEEKKAVAPEAPNVVAPDIPGLNEPQIANVADALKAGALGNAVYVDECIPAQQEKKQVDIAQNGAKAVEDWYERFQKMQAAQDRAQRERRMAAQQRFYYNGGDKIVGGK